MPAPHLSRTPLAAAVAALLALGATGCAEADPAPRTLPALATPTASATPNVPPVPVEAEAVTPQGAAAFARHWFDALNSAIATGDAAALRSLSVKECTACEGFAFSAEETKRLGERYIGGHFTVRFAEAPAITDPSRAAVTVIYDRSLCRLVGQDGATLKTFAAKANVAGEMTLVAVAGSWRARELAVQR